jgi:hypothetical protein
LTEAVPHYAVGGMLTSAHMIHLIRGHESPDFYRLPCTGAGKEELPHERR